MTWLRALNRVVWVAQLGWAESQKGRNMKKLMIAAAAMAAAFAVNADTDSGLVSSTVVG